MRYYPYYKFSHETYPIFKSFHLGINKVWFSQIFIFFTTGLQFIFYSALYERFIRTHSFWERLRFKRMEKKNAFDNMIRINADLKPNIIKEFSSF